MELVLALLLLLLLLAYSTWCVDGQQVFKVPLLKQPVNPNNNNNNHRGSWTHSLFWWNHDTPFNACVFCVPGRIIAISAIQLFTSWGVGGRRRQWGERRERGGGGLWGWRMGLPFVRRGQHFSPILTSVEWDRGVEVVGQLIKNVHIHLNVDFIRMFIQSYCYAAYY